MKLKALLIPVDDPPRLIEIERQGDSALAALKEVVGGWIEGVGWPEIPEAAGYINEEGKLLGLEPNRLATAIYKERNMLFPGDFIAGPLVVCGVDDEGESVDVPVAVLDDMERMGLPVA